MNLWYSAKTGGRNHVLQGIWPLRPLLGYGPVQDTITALHLCYETRSRHHNLTRDNELSEGTAFSLAVYLKELLCPLQWKNNWIFVEYLSKHTNNQQCINFILQSILFFKLLLPTYKFLLFYKMPYLLLAGIWILLQAHSDAGLLYSQTGHNGQITKIIWMSQKY